MEMKEKTMKSQEKTSRLEDALTNVRTSQQREQFLKQYTEDGYDRLSDHLNVYMAVHDLSFLYTSDAAAERGRVEREGSAHSKQNRSGKKT